MSLEDGVRLRGSLVGSVHPGIHIFCVRRQLLLALGDKLDRPLHLARLLQLIVLVDLSLMGVVDKHRISPGLQVYCIARDNGWISWVGISSLVHDNRLSLGPCQGVTYLCGITELHVDFVLVAQLSSWSHLLLARYLYRLVSSQSLINAECHFLSWHDLLILMVLKTSYAHCMHRIARSSCCGNVPLIRQALVLDNL